MATARKTTTTKAKAVPAKKTAVKKPATKTVAKEAPKKRMFTKKEKEVTPAPKLRVKGKTPKDIATAKGEPWVEIMSVELDPDNVGNGAFELDWNDIFVAKLIRAGYQGKTDADIVDNWFKTICRNVVMEEYEQWEANQDAVDRPRVIERRGLGDGKVEVS